MEKDFDALSIDLGEGKKIFSIISNIPKETNTFWLYIFFREVEWGLSHSFH